MMTSDKMKAETIPSTEIRLKTPKHDRGQWTRQSDFLFTLIGYSVGFGNIWRFPYLCMRNGGGAFLIPYFLFLFLCGMPLFYMELCIGQFSSLSSIAVWKVSPLFKGIGWAMLAITATGTVSHNTILTWVLYYLSKSFTTNLPWQTCNNPWNTPACVDNSYSERQNMTRIANLTALINYSNSSTNETKAMSPTEEFWQFEVLQLTEGIHQLGGIRWQLVLALLVGWIIVFGCMCKGVKSIGKVVYVTVPCPYILLLILLIRGLTLDGSMDGIHYYLTPEWNKLLEFKVWAEACMQIFFTLGPAWGGIITMASYNRFHNNALRDSVIVCLTCCGTSFFAGFVIFSIIGVMAKQLNVQVSEVITAGPGLAFVAYPEALTMLPFSPFWAVLFFLMLLTIGLDTQFTTFENVTSGLIDVFPQYLQHCKTRFIAFMSVIMFILGLLFISRGGMYIFQIFDWYIGSFSCMVICLFECIALCYVYGIKRLSYDIKMMQGRELPIWFKICWCFITPLLILFITVYNCFQMSEPTYGDYEYPTWAIGIGWLIALFSMVPIPVVGIVMIMRTKGTLMERLRYLARPSKDWGPALEEHRMEHKYNNVSNVEHKLDPLI